MSKKAVAWVAVGRISQERYLLGVPIARSDLSWSQSGVPSLAQHISTGFFHTLHLHAVERPVCRTVADKHSSSRFDESGAGILLFNSQRYIIQVHSAGATGAPAVVHAEVEGNRAASERCHVVAARNPPAQIRQRLIDVVE